MNYENSQGLATALFEESGDGLFLCDPETNQLVDANSMAQRLTGFLLRELLRTPVNHLFRSRAPDNIRRLWRAFRKTEVFQTQEGYLLCTVQPGVWIPVTLTVARLHLQPKTLALITARDVRPQEQAYAELKKKDAELRRVFASVPECLWEAEVADACQLRYHYFSPAVEALTGQAPGFFLPGTHRWWSLVHPEDRPRWERALARSLSGRAGAEEYRLVRADGGVRWVRETVAVHAPEKEPPHVLGTITDITDRKNLENALRDSEERFRAFMDNSPAVAFMKDGAGRFIYFNRTFCRRFQGPHADLLGKTDFDLFPDPVARALRENDAAVLARQEPVQVIEHMPTPDGQVRSWLVSKFPVPGTADGLALGGVAIEIPERKPSEEPTS